MWPSPPFGDPCLASGAEQAQLRQEIGATCEPQIVEPHLDFRRPDVGKAFLVEGQTLVDEIQPEDQVFDIHGVNIIVDSKSLIYLDGTELDFVKEGLNEGFKFNNPNKKGECGCGESFTV